MVVDNGMKLERLLPERNKLFQDNCYLVELP